MFGMAGQRLEDRVIYGLEKMYSQMISIHHQVSVVNDPAMGTSQRNETIVSVRAIVLPETLVRRHIYDASYLGSSRNFTYGALFDQYATPIIIKASRVAFKLDNNDYCIVRGNRYDFKKVSYTMSGKSYHILTQQSPMVGAEDYE